MRKDIQIGARAVGEGRPLFIVAEAGVTCNYDVKLTKELIDVVREAGADAIKLIFWFPDEIMSDLSVQYSYDTVDGPRSENMYEMLQGLRFTLDQWFEVKRYADERGVVLFSTVNSPSGIDYAERLELVAYKLSSWDYNYAPLWRRIAALGKPMIMDTGPVNSLEVARVLRIMQDSENDQALLVHCTHTDDDAELNMRTIPYLRAAFGTPAGYSAKGREWETDIIAVTLGASFLEKRLTISRHLSGHHHILSLEPAEFTEYVQRMRAVQQAQGVLDLIPSPADLEERKQWFRHLVATADLSKGTCLTAAMLEGRRPEAGVSPEYLELFVGRELKRDLTRNEAISWDDV